MPQGPMGLFGWLMSCCVSDAKPHNMRDLYSTAIVFASGMATSVLTLYVAGILHIF